MDVYIGIDVACAKDKYLPLVVCRKDNDRLLPLPLGRFSVKPPKGVGNAATLNDDINTAVADEVVRYIEAVCNAFNLSPVRIGIDSPLRPRNNQLKRRVAEQALDRAGIHCYTTPSADDFELIKRKGLSHLNAGRPMQRLPHSMQIFMLLGFALNSRLSDIAPCIEVYPHATMQQLGAASVHKTKRGQAQSQLSAMAKFTRWPTSQAEWEQAESICFGPMHDKVDAYSAAWVASLPEKERVCFGEPNSGDAIWAPRVDTKLFAPSDKQQTSRGMQQTDGTRHQKRCPACNQHLFKRWPFGWDAHAAHRCTGLAAREPEARKKEFKMRFL